MTRVSQVVKSSSIHTVVGVLMVAELSLEKFVFLVIGADFRITLRLIVQLHMLLVGSPSRLLVLVFVVVFWFN